MGRNSELKAKKMSTWLLLELDIMMVMQMSLNLSVMCEQG